MLPLEDAQALLLSHIQPLDAETVSLHEAGHRIAAVDLPAPIDLPPFDNSAMDGFAIRAADVATARAASPVTLQLIGEVPAGSVFQGAMVPRTCVRIFTGSPLPAGADAVIMQEDTLTDGTSVQVLEAAKPWENIRLRGEDLKRGAVALTRGSRIGIGRLALLAALGAKSLSVARRPVVGILSTGSELREAGRPLAGGEVYESNRIAIAALATAAGAIPRIYPLVRDTADATHAAILQAFRECDAVISTGGVSVGEHDHVKAAFQRAGGELEFWKVAIRPGKPFVFGRREGKCLFGLPGNPVSAFVTFLLLTRPALLRMQGATEVGLPKARGTLAQPLSNPAQRRHFVRVIIDASGAVRSAGIQASHALSSLGGANGLLDLQPGAALAAGTEVDVLRWESD